MSLNSRIICWTLWNEQLFLELSGMKKEKLGISGALKRLIIDNITRKRGFMSIYCKDSREELKRWRLSGTEIQILGSETIERIIFGNFQGKIRNFWSRNTKFDQFLQILAVKKAQLRDRKMSEKLKKCTWKDFNFHKIFGYVSNNS